MFKLPLSNIISFLSLIGALLSPQLAKLSQRYSREVLLGCASFFVISCLMLGSFMYLGYDPSQSGIQYFKLHLLGFKYHTLYTAAFDLSQLSLNFMLATIVITSALFILGAWKIKYPILVSYVGLLLRIQGLMVVVLSNANAGAAFYAFMSTVILFLMFNLLRILRFSVFKIENRI